jgi:FkbM family methyltransferase
MRTTKITYDLTLEQKDLRLPYMRVDAGVRTLLYSDSGRIARKRVEGLYHKEPTTIAWLESFTQEDLLFDVGANVGMYTVYAGAWTGCRVCAFEPEALNYAELNKNIQLNKLDRHVTAYCCAVTDEVGLDILYLSALAPSNSHHDFGECRWEGPATRMGPSAEARPRQGCFGVTLDHLAQSLGTPTHLKIDVDGLEHLVLQGGQRTLEDPKLRTVLLENDFSLAHSAAMVQLMENLGFQWSLDQVTTWREWFATPEEFAQMRAEKRGGQNFIFYRDPGYGKLFRKFREHYQQFCQRQKGK